MHSILVTFFLHRKQALDHKLILRFLVEFSSRYLYKSVYLRNIYVFKILNHAGDNSAHVKETL